MKTVVTRVNSAKVSVDGSAVADIEGGLLVLTAFTDGDDEKTVKTMARKIARLRIFEDDAGKMNLDVKSHGGRILTVPQFTLYADLTRGNRPSFFKALDKKKASDLYDVFNRCLKDRQGLDVACGIFGAHMDVSSVNDGPVTIIIDSRDI
jgi:D-tyrosyl-tRNA(Tyr) deacylase